MTDELTRYLLLQNLVDRMEFDSAQKLWKLRGPISRAEYEALVHAVGYVKRSSLLKEASK